MYVLNQKNTDKIGQNFNKCLEKSTGEFVMISSGDDKICENVISKMVQEILKNQHIQITISSSHVIIDNNSNIKEKYNFDSILFEGCYVKKEDLDITKQNINIKCALPFFYELKIGFFDRKNIQNIIKECNKKNEK